MRKGIVYFFFCGILVIGGFFSYKDQCEKIIITAGEKVYVSIAGFFMERDALIPDVDTLLSPQD